MENKLYSLQEAQDIGSKLVEKRSLELKKDLEELKNNNDKKEIIIYDLKINV